MARGRQLRVIKKEFKSLSEVAEEFLNFNEAKRLSSQTQSSYKRRVAKFVNFAGADEDVEVITPQLLDKYLLYLSKSGIKDVTIQTDMRHLRTFINYCIKHRYIYDIDIPMPRVEETIKEAYTDEEIQLLLKKPKGNNWVTYRNWCMVCYFYSTGQRLSTVLNIKVEDIDLAEHKVKLVHNKDKRQKYMPLSSALVNILIEYIYVSGLEQGDYLFPEYEGKQLTIRGAQDAIAAYNKSRGVEKTSIHLFRHCFACNYIKNGGNPAKLQKLLNHKTIHMTMHYVNLYADDIAEDLDKLNPLDNFKDRLRGQHKGNI